MVDKDYGLTTVTVRGRTIQGIEYVPCSCVFTLEIVMIFEIRYDYLYGNDPFIVPLFETTPTELYSVLTAAFPYNRDTYDSRYGMWQFFQMKDAVHVAWCEQTKWS